MDQAGAGGDDLLDLRQQVGDRGEAEGDALERRLAQVAAVVAKVRPITAPLASGFQPVERSPPRKGRNMIPWSSRARPRRPPSSSVSSSQTRRFPPSESAPPSTTRRSSTRYMKRPGRGRAPRSRRGSAGSGGADRERSAPAGAAGAEVRADAVDQSDHACGSREPRQPLAVDAEELEQLLVPAARAARSSRPVPDAIETLVAARREQLPVVGERDEARRSAEDVRLGLGEPGELRRPVASGGGAGRCGRARPRRRARAQLPAAPAARCPASRAPA